MNANTIKKEAQKEAQKEARREIRNSYKESRKNLREIADKNIRKEEMKNLRANYKMARKVIKQSSKINNVTEKDINNAVMTILTAIASDKLDLDHIDQIIPLDEVMACLNDYMAKKATETANETEAA